MGRQNIMKNEGFLIFEGNPGDGSRSVYFNAAVLGYTWKKSKLELMGIDNPRTDRFLPRFHNRSKTLQDWSDQALGAYYTDANLKNTAVEAYYFYKKEVRDTRAPSHPQFQPDRHVSTAGGRVVQKFQKGWSATGELGLQWGAQHPNTSITGRGGYAYVKKTFGDAGQELRTRRLHRHVGRQPCHHGQVRRLGSDLLALAQVQRTVHLQPGQRESGGLLDQHEMWQAEAVYSPVKPVSVRFTFYRMNSSYPFKGSASTFGAGTVRGNMPQVRVDYAHNARWKGHILYERLSPGSFYSVQSPSHFLRFEVIYTLTGTVKG